MKRQQLLAQPGAPELWTVLDEAVLRRAPGGAAVMRAQLAHLLELTALANLTLVTVNPAYRGDELAHVLGHSEADGLFMADEYQGADLHAILAKAASIGAGQRLRYT